MVLARRRPRPGRTGGRTQGHLPRVRPGAGEDPGPVVTHLCRPSAVLLWASASCRTRRVLGVGFPQAVSRVREETWMLPQRLFHPHGHPHAPFGRLGLRGRGTAVWPSTPSLVHVTRSLG